MVLVCFMWLPVTINVRSSIYKIAYHNVSQILAHHSSSNLSGQPLASNSSRSRARTSARQSGYFWGSSMETPLGNAEWLPQLLLLDISFACGDWRDWLTSSHLLVFHVFCVPSSGLSILMRLIWFKPSLCNPSGPVSSSKLQSTWPSATGSSLDSQEAELAERKGFLKEVGWGRPTRWSTN